jgi:hypothetical protein
VNHWKKQNHQITKDTKLGNSDILCLVILVRSWWLGGYSQIATGISRPFAFSERNPGWFYRIIGKARTHRDPEVMSRPVSQRVGAIPALSNPSGKRA